MWAQLSERELSEGRIWRSPADHGRRLNHTYSAPRVYDFGPVGLAADVVGGAIGTAGVIATAPLGYDSYAYTAMTRVLVALLSPARKRSNWPLFYLRVDRMGGTKMAMLLANCRQSLMSHAAD